MSEPTKICALEALAIEAWKEEQQARIERDEHQLSRFKEERRQRIIGIFAGLFDVEPESVSFDEDASRLATPVAVARFDRFEFRVQDHFKLVAYLPCPECDGQLRSFPIVNRKNALVILGSFVTGNCEPHTHYSGDDDGGGTLTEPLPPTAAERLVSALEEIIRQLIPGEPDV